MRNWKTIGAVIASVFFVGIGFGQTIFAETMGAVGGTTSIATHETANGFDNTVFTMSGTGDLRSTSASSGYSGASGSANVFLTNNGTSNFQIATISTLTCSDLVLSFGAFKSTTASNMSELVVEFSTDGVSYTPVAIPLQPTGTGTAVWRLITVNLPAAAGNQANLRLRWTNSASGTGSPQFRIDDVSLAGVCGSLSVDAISNVSYTVNCQQADDGTIDFTATGTYLAGNSFQVELSDATGNFASSVFIGSLSGAAAEGTTFSGTIPFSIPAVMPAGSGYRMRLVSTNPVRISPNNGIDINIDLTGTCVPPHVTSLILNACNSSCSEGDNELFFGNTGDYSLEFTADNTNVFYGSSPSPTANYITSIHDLPLVTAEFNTNAGCPGLFIDAYDQVVPPNSSFILAHRNVCPNDLYDFTNLCGSGPIYLVYVDASGWSSAGNFSNSTSCSGGFRYLRSLFSTTVFTSHEINFFYECALNSGSTGDFAVWNASGGAATLQSNTSCSFDPIVLPIELLVFSAKPIDSQVRLNWSTATELNNDYFTIERSVDGSNWEVVDLVKGQGTTAQQSDYELMDTRPFSGLSYYRLKQTDYDGTFSYSSIVSVSVSVEPKKRLKVVNAIGQEVQPGTPGLVIHFYDDGSSEKIVNH